LAIADCRQMITEGGVAPERLYLPEVSMLMDWKGSTDQLYFIKLDLTNAFWSTLLPKKFPKIFRFKFRGKCLALLSLPFGWNASPAIFQKSLAKVLKEALRGCDGILVGQCMDDILAIGYGFRRMQEVAF